LPCYVADTSLVAEEILLNHFLLQSEGEGSLAVDYFTFSSTIADHLRSASLVISHAGMLFANFLSIFLFTNLLCNYRHIIMWFSVYYYIWMPSRSQRFHSNPRIFPATPTNS